MFLLSWQLTIISFMLFSRYRISTLLAQVREASFESQRLVQVYFSGTEFINRTVQSFAAQDFERRRFSNANLKLLEASEQSKRIQASIEPLRKVATIRSWYTDFGILRPYSEWTVADSFVADIFICLIASATRRQLDGARVKLSTFQGCMTLMSF